MRLPFRFALLFLSLSVFNLTAQVEVDLNVSPSGSVFHYDVSVSNNGAVDLTLVTLTDAPPNDATIDSSLVAPLGFLALYDSSLGLVDFLEMSATFVAGTTVSGFSFDSQFAPGTYFTSFEALDINGDSTRGTIRVLVSGVPDAGSTIVLLGLGTLILAAGHAQFQFPRRNS